MIKIKMIDIKLKRAVVMALVVLGVFTNCHVALARMSGPVNYGWINMPRHKGNVHGYWWSSPQGEANDHAYWWNVAFSDGQYAARFWWQTAGRTRCHG